MSHCKFETLMSNREGIAARCRDCGELHIGFSSFLLAFSPAEFPGFVENMEANYKIRSQDNICCHAKNIVIPTPMREVALLFSLEELGRFVRFLRQVGDLLLVKDLANQADGRDNPSMFN